MAGGSGGGGGGGQEAFNVAVIFGRFNGAIDPSDLTGWGQFDIITYAAELSSFIQPQATTLTEGNVTASETSSDAALTFSDSITFEGIDPIDFGGKKLHKVALYCPISARAKYSSGTGNNIKLTVNTKIEILDGSTVKATWTNPAAKDDAGSGSLSRSLSFMVLAVLDLAGITISDLKIKVTIETTVSTVTNLTQHRHEYLGYFSGGNRATFDMNNYKAGKAVFEVRD